MLFLDSLRGKDSTGVFVVTTGGNVEIAKDATHAYQFQQHREYDNIMSTALIDGLFLVGHNRAATRGAVVPKNAHPFWVNDEIVLVQNGTWAGDHKHVKDTEVDTEALAHIIAEETKIQNALKKINAAYALVWYNVKKGELYLLRNDERPLYIANSKDGALLWASEPEFITFAASRSRLELKAAPYMLLEDNLVTLKRVDKSWELDNTAVDTKFVYPKVVGEKVRGSKTHSHSSASNPPAPTAMEVFKGKTIHHYAHEGTFADWHIEDIQTAKIIQSEFAVKKGEVYLELVDFMPIGQSNSEWYLIFNEVSADADNPGPVFWTSVNNVSEDELAKQISSPFVSARVGSPIIHIIGKDTKEEQYVVLSRISDMKSVITEVDGHATVH